MRAIGGFLGWAWLGAAAAVETCLDLDSSCPIQCPIGASWSRNSEIDMQQYPHFVQQWYELQDELVALDRDNVLNLDGFGNSTLHRNVNFHVTFNYFCCHTLLEEQRLYEMLEAFDWGDLQLKFAGMGCNLSQSNDNLVYIHTLLDEESEKALSELMVRLEEYLREGGIAINNPRRQTFHNTLARVNRDYPTDEFVNAHKDDEYGTLKFDNLSYLGRAIEF